jgi:hypothetical protein
LNGTATTEIYTASYTLSLPDALTIYELVELVKGGARACLLCYERDVGHCHRSKIAEIVTERTGARVTDLAPPLFE